MPKNGINFHKMQHCVSQSFQFTVKTFQYGTQLATSNYAEQLTLAYSCPKSQRHEQLIIKITHFLPR